MWKKLFAVLIGISVGYFLIDDFNPESIRGKNVLVTGASTGIGEQIAYHYAKLGANVVITARRENRLKEVVAKCRELAAPGQVFHYVVADMMVLNSTGKVIQETIKALGSLDYLVLNHIALQDIGRWDGSTHNITLADRILTINFRSYIHLASHSLPHLKKSSGSIVVVNSLAGKMGQPFLSIYSASKFALDGFFSGLRQEMLLTNCDISITVCIIGFIRTENCISQLQRHGQDFMVNNLNPSSPSDAALAIIKGGASRAKEIYFPYMEIRPMVVFRDWFPSILEYVIRSVYNSDAFS